MAELTGISWTDHTFNPWWGCVKISPACDNCYAERDSIRYGHPIWGKDSPRRFFSDEHWKKPLIWNLNAKVERIRKRVFCASMADVMEDRPDLVAPRERLFRLIELTPWLDWLLLTKRPMNFRKLLPLEWAFDPLPNVWLGTTVESPSYFWRIDALKEVPAVVHFLSCEPLVARLTGLEQYVRDIEWIIAGGESGPIGKARPLDPEWVNRIRDICLAKGIPFHFKQWGEYGSDMVRIGKKAAGSLIEGVDWKQFPQIQTEAR